LPLLPGTTLEEKPSGVYSSRATVAFRGPCTLLLKPSAKSNYRVELTRSQPFAKASTADQITEYSVVKSFVHAVQRIAPGLGQVFERDILNGLGRRVIARAVTDNTHQLQTVLIALNQLTSWAARSYEGKPIVAAIGVGEDKVGDVEFYDVCREDF